MFLCFFFPSCFITFPPSIPRIQICMGKGRGLVRCQLRSPALEPQLPSGEAGPPQEPALTWLGGARSPQEAEPTFTLLSYSSSVKYQASAPWVTKNPTNEQFMFHMLPSDSKRVAKTAARLFQSGGLEVPRWITNLKNGKKLFFIPVQKQGINLKDLC